MSYKRLNDLTGWAVWGVATIVFLLTIEPAASFWDCGEFIASAYKLEVGHPPGAPLYMLIARLFSMFVPVAYVATAVNAISALSSSFTILFLFWSITHLARKMALKRAISSGDAGDSDAASGLSKGARLAVLASGVVGALAYTFSDSFWFSATEGEVYAMSSLFTAVVFWAILKWEAHAEEAGNLRWIVLIAYLMGLSIGVHLLNLLAIPAIVAVYYFKRYKFSWIGFAVALASSLGILLFVQVGLIQGFIKLAGWFELHLVNDFGLPFNSGVVVYALLVMGGLAGLLYISRQKGWWGLNLAALGTTMILIGYSTFALIVVRSLANPPMDENNPDNLFALLSYLNREQYGDRPLAEGQYWNSPNDAENPYDDGRSTWIPSHSIYQQRGAVEQRVATFREVESAEKRMAELALEDPKAELFILQEYYDSGEKRNAIANYDPQFTSIFPRMYSAQATHIAEYKNWSNFKGWNEQSTFDSPLDGRTRTGAAFESHLSSAVLGGGLEQSEMQRVLTAMYRAKGQRFAAKYEVRSSTELILRASGGEGARLADLTNRDIRETVAEMMMAELAQNSGRGRGYVQALESQLQQLEGQRRSATIKANQTRAEVDIRAAQSIDKQISSMHERLMPSMAENLTFFVDYQIGWMYLRYFMWNFSGRQNDSQGHGNNLDGNWLSGIDLIDAERVGNRAELSPALASNKALNHFYYFPLLLGLIGLIFQGVHATRDFTVAGLLFVLTGLAIVVYLNQYPLQPRERDYAFVGSFYAFTIWIGLGVYALWDLASRLKKTDLPMVMGAPIAAGVLLFVVETATGGGHALSYSLLFMGLVSAVWIGLSMLLKKTFGSENAAMGVGAMMLLCVPMVMAADGWDDHSRAGRSTGVDMAKNYMDSLAPNAIVFTNGDNDTFPLWFVQEVEGYRTDVRIVNLSLLNTDWYANQMKRRAYESAPVPIKINEEQYRQGTRDIVLLDRGSSNPEEKYFDLDAAMTVALDDDDQVDYGGGRLYAHLPSSSFSLPVDSAAVMASGMLSEDEAKLMVDRLEWTISDRHGSPKSYVLKNQFMVLDMLRNNNWERPIYFAVTIGPDSYMGLEDYFRLEGLAWRLVPVKYGLDRGQPAGVDTDRMYRNVMEDFQYGGMQGDREIYMDENNRRMATNITLQLTHLAQALLDEGDAERSLDVVEHLIASTPAHNVPYTRVQLPTVQLYCQLAADSDLSGERKAAAVEDAQALALGLFDWFEGEATYHLSLEQGYYEQNGQQLSMAAQVMARLESTVKRAFPDSELSADLTARLAEIRKTRTSRDAGLDR